MKLSLQDDKAENMRPSATVKLSLQDDKAENMRPSATVKLSLQDDKSLLGVNRHGWDHDLGYGGGAAGET
jgi:hypothetical protein